MAQGVKSAQARLGKRMLIQVLLGDELWFEHLASGEKKTILVAAGWHTRSDAPGVTLFAITLLWLQLIIGMVKNNDEPAP